MYKILGVAEVWQYTKQEGVQMYALEQGEYMKIEASAAFPRLSANKLNEFLEMRQTQSENQVIRALRNWV